MVLREDSILEEEGCSFKADTMLERVVKRITMLAENLLRLEGALPRLEQATLKVVDVMFAPRQVAIQIAIASVLHVLVVGCRAAGRAFEQRWRRLTSKIGRRMFELEFKMEHSRSYQEWLKHAYELDVLRGLDKWRREENDSPLMDARMLRKRVSETDRMLEAGDLFDLMFRLRGGLMRDQWGTSHEGMTENCTQNSCININIETLSLSLSLSLSLTLSLSPVHISPQYLTHVTRTHTHTHTRTFLSH